MGCAGQARELQWNSFFRRVAAMRRHSGGGDAVGFLMGNVWLIVMVALSGAAIIVALAPFRSNFWRLAPLGILLLGGDFVFRPFELVLGLDEPFPDAVFEGRSVDDAMLRAQASWLLWLALFCVSWWLASRLSSPVVRRVDPGRFLPSDEAVVFVLPALAVVAVLASVPVWLEHGVFDLAEVAKGRETPLPRELRNPSVIVAYLGMAAAVVGWQRRNRAWVAIGVVSLIVGGAVSLTWGARSAAVLPFVILLVAVVAGTTERAEGPLVRRLAIVAGLVIFVLAVGFGLRVVREVVAFGGTLDRTTEGSVVRRLAVTANHTGYDSTLLLFDEDSSLPEEAGFGVFVDATRFGLRPLLGTGRQVVAPSIVVAQAYEPNRRNGWAMSVIGEWFYARRWLGIGVGALVSGALFGVIDPLLGHIRRSRWIVAATTVVLVLTFLADGGYRVTSAMRGRGMLVMFGGVLAVAFVVDRLRQRRSSSAGRLPVESGASSESPC